MRLTGQVAKKTQEQLVSYLGVEVGGGGRGVGGGGGRDHVGVEVHYIAGPAPRAPAEPWPGVAQRKGEVSWWWTPLVEAEAKLKGL